MGNTKFSFFFAFLCMLLFSLLTLCTNPPRKVDVFLIIWHNPKSIKTEMRQYDFKVTTNTREYGHLWLKLRLPPERSIGRGQPHTKIGSLLKRFFLVVIKLF